jgi:hypothetical protein
MAEIQPTQLYWSRQGQVSCGEHAPRKDSDTWIWDGWRRVTLRDVFHSGGKDVEWLRCERCGRRFETL